MSTTYKVNGMTCGGCASSVTRAIAALEPAATVSVDLEAGTVTVDGPASDEAVGRAVGNAGFEFGGRVPS